MKTTYQVEYVKNGETFWSTVEAEKGITCDELEEMQVEEIDVISIKDIYEY